MSVKTLRDIIRHGAEAYGTETAFRCKVKREVVDRSYQDVNWDSMSISRMVESTGMGGKHIILIGTTTYRWIVDYFGIADSGSAAVPIDVQLPAGAMCGLLGRADVEMLTFDEIRWDVAETAKEKCPRVRQIISMQAAEPGDGTQFLPIQMAIHTGEYEIAIDSNQACITPFTPETTGRSKGVVLSHRNLAGSVIYLDIKIPTGVVSMTLLPTSHVCYLTMDIIKGLYIELVICINDSIMYMQKSMKLFKPEIVLLISLAIEFIHEELRDADNLMSKKMMAKAAFGGSLRTICSDGAYLDPDYVKRFKEYGITIPQGYNMMERFPVISTDLEWDHETGSVGRLLPNCETKTVDEEIWVRGAGAMQGYYKIQKKTDQALENGWFEIGDLGYVDEDNFPYITGRRKNLTILSNEENVFPEGLENQLSYSDLVREVLIREKDKVIEAEIFPDHEYTRKRYVKDTEGGLRELIDKFNRDTPVYKRTYGLIIREAEFEKTSSKKIKRF